MLNLYKPLENIKYTLITVLLIKYRIMSMRLI